MHFPSIWWPRDITFVKSGLVQFFTLNFHPSPWHPLLGLWVVFFCILNKLKFSCNSEACSSEKNWVDIQLSYFHPPQIQKLATFIQHIKHTIVLLPICILRKYSIPKCCWLFYYWYHNFTCHRLSLKHAHLLPESEVCIFTCRSRIAIFICTQTTLLHLAVMGKVFKNNLRRKWRVI